MRRRFFSFAMTRPMFLAVPVLAMGAGVIACNQADNTLACGPGTQQIGHECLLVDGGPTPIPGGPPAFAGVTSVSPVSASALQVAWAPATDAATAQDQIKYNVYIATATGAENFKSPKLTTAPGAKSAIVTGLAPDNSTWFVVVRAVNQAGAEDQNVVELSGKASSDSTAPTFGGVTKVDPAGAASVKLSWDPASDPGGTPAAGITYEAFWADKASDMNFSKPVAVSDPGASSMILSGLPAPNATFAFAVRARDAAGNTDQNKVVLTGTSGADTTPPVFAGCKSVGNVTATTVQLFWDEASDDTSAPAQIVYDVYASSTSGAEDFSKVVGSFTGGNGGTVTGLTNDTDYFLICRARDATGNQEKNTQEVHAHTSKDSTPPTFAGVTAIGNIKSSTVDLSWATPASDDKTAVADIVYVAYAATAPGGEDFKAAPAGISQPGATTMTVSGLQSGTNYYFVVRARDEAGNEDNNTKEVNGTTLIGFTKDIQAIFTANCAVTGCHVPGTPPAGMILASGFAYGMIVNVVSQENPPMVRIKPGDADNSYLNLKINGKGAAGTLLMPPPSTGTALTQAQKDLIKNWILQGALND